MSYRQSLACGPGRRTRSLECRDARTSKVRRDCATFVELPRTEDECDVGPCDEPTWVVTAYAPATCPARCGGGWQSRGVFCRFEDGAVPDEMCYATDGEGGQSTQSPQQHKLCNPHACQRYSWQPAQWGSCGSPCGDGVQKADMLCLAEETTLLGHTSRCFGEATAELASLAALSRRQCSFGDCAASGVAVSEWRPCNLQCGGGVTTRDVSHCWVNGSSIVEAVAVSSMQECLESVESLAIEVPSLHRSCNTAACPADVLAYRVGEWSECSDTCGGGTRSRDVDCISYANGEVTVRPLAECAATLAVHVSIPAASTLCNTQPCEDVGFCDDRRFPCSNRGRCMSRGSKSFCDCDEGYAGPRCERLEECPVGSTMDIEGCCETAVIDTETLLCCRPPADDPTTQPKLDAYGRCCPTGLLDACGRCNGPARVVSATGECCNTQLDAAGNCCHSGNVDACGVCDGTGECPAQIGIAARLVDGVSVPTAFATGVAESIRDTVYDVLGLPVGGSYEVDVHFRDPDAVSEVARRLHSRAAQKQLRGLQTAQDIPEEIIITISADGVTQRVGLSLDMLELSGTGANQVLAVEVLSVLGPTSLSRVATCGNQRCEVGERCHADERATAVDCCPEDCPHEHVECPTTIDSSAPCDGHGLCVAATGECTCFVGYTGDACNECSTGYDDTRGLGLNSVDYGDGEAGFISFGPYDAGSCGVLILPPAIVVPDNITFVGIQLMQGPEVFVPEPKGLWILGTAVTLCCFFALFRCCSRDQKDRLRIDPPEFVLNDDVKLAKWPILRTTKFSAERPESLVVLNPNLSAYDKRTRLKLKEKQFKVWRPPNAKTLQRYLLRYNIKLKLKSDGVPPPDPPFHRKPEELPKLIVERLTPTTVSLSWPRPEYDGNRYGIDHYIVAYRTEEGGTVSCSTDSDLCSFVIGGGGGTPPSKPLPRSCELFEVRVSAVNKGGESLDALMIPYMRSAGFANPPTYLEVISKTTTSFVLAWEPPTDNGGSEITGYEVGFTTEDGERVIVKGNGLECRLAVGEYDGTPPVPPFKDGAMFKRVSVRAVNGAGSGPWAPRKRRGPGGEIATLRLPQTPPQQPIELAAGDTLLDRIPIAWVQPSGPAVEFYQIAYTTMGTPITTTTASNAPKFVIGGGGGEPRSVPLPEGTLVENISVTAVGPTGQSKPSTSISASTVLLPHPPVKIRAAKVAGSTIKLEWIPPQKTGGPPITSYKVTYTLGAARKEDERRYVIDTEEPIPCFTIGQGLGLPASLPLTPGDPIKDISVCSVTRAGDGPFSEHEITTRTQAVPGAPEDVQVGMFEKVGDGINERYVATIPVKWKVPRDISSVGVDPAIPEYYVIRYFVGDTKFVCNTRTVIPADSIFRFSIGSGAGVPASTRLALGDVVEDIQVCAVNSVGQGPWSEPALSAEMPQLCEAPRRLHVLDIQTGGGVVLGWDAPPFGKYTPAPHTYIIEYYLDSGERVSFSTDSEDTTYHIGSGLGTPPAPSLRGGDTIKMIRIRALSSVGYGPWSGAVSSVTAKDYAGPARNLRILPYTHRTVPIEWDLPANLGGRPVENWIVRYSTKGLDYEISTGSDACHFVIGSRDGKPRSDRLYLGVPVMNISVQPVTREVGLGAICDPIPKVVPHTIAGEPSTLSVVRSAMGLGTIPLTWLPPSGEYDGEVVSYRLQYSLQLDKDLPDDEEAEVFTVVTNSSATEFILGGGGGTPPSEPLPERQKVYNLAVSAVTTVGDSGYSVALPPITALGRADAVRRIGVTNITATTVHIAWLKPRNNGGSDITSYLITWHTGERDLHGRERRPEDVSTEGNHELRSDGPISSIELGIPEQGTGTLWPGTPVTDIRVRAITQAGVGRLHDELPPLRTKSAPTVPRDVKIKTQVRGHEGTFGISWMTPADDGDQPVTAYSVRYTVGGEEFTTVMTASSVDLGALHDGRCAFQVGAGGGTPPSMRLKPNEPVTHVSVAALNSVGESERAEFDVNMTPTAVYPPRPRAPAVVRVVVETGEVVVAWTDPIKELFQRRARETIMFSDGDNIISFEIASKQVSGWAKAVHAVSLDKQFATIREYHVDEPTLDDAELLRRYEERSSAAAAWPSWFDHEFAVDEGAWQVAGEMALLKPTKSIVQSHRYTLPARCSFEFRVRCRNGFGMWSEWSEVARPTLIPAVHTPRPSRVQVRELERSGAGGGYLAEHGEVARFIRDNLAADEALAADFVAWIQTQWRELRQWCSNQREWLKRERAMMEAAGVSRQVDHRRKALGWARSRVVEMPEWEEFLRKRAKPKVRKDKIGSAVERARARWVPLAKTAAAGRVDLVEMLPAPGDAKAATAARLPGETPSFRLPQLEELDAGSYLDRAGPASPLRSSPKLQKVKSLGRSGSQRSMRRSKTGRRKPQLPRAGTMGALGVVRLGSFHHKDLPDPASSRPASADSQGTEDDDLLALLGQRPVSRGGAGGPP